MNTENCDGTFILGCRNTEDLSCLFTADKGFSLQPLCVVSIVDGGLVC